MHKRPDAAAYTGVGSECENGSARRSNGKGAVRGECPQCCIVLVSIGQFRRSRPAAVASVGSDHDRSLLLLYRTLLLVTFACDHRPAAVG